MSKKDIATIPTQQHSLGESLYRVAVHEVIEKKTPDSEKERVPGKDFDYVRVGYMRRQMDDAFPLSWDVEFFETANAETLLKAKAIVVKARITIRDPQTRFAILVREAFGGSEVKFRKGTTDPLDLGNDYKSAQADAMKKAISLLGICSDVYEPVVEKREDKREEEQERQNHVITMAKESVLVAPEASITKETWQFLVGTAAARKVTIAQLQAFLVEKGWKGEDGKVKPSLVKNKDIPTIEAWIADAPPF